MLYEHLLDTLNTAEGKHSEPTEEMGTCVVGLYRIQDEEGSLSDSLYQKTLLEKGRNIMD